MKRPASCVVEDGRIWNIRRSTAEAMAADGLLTLGMGDTMTTWHTLTEKGVAFFATEPGRRFKWTEDAAEPRPSTIADFFAASLDLRSEYFVPVGSYEDERALIGGAA